MGVEETCPTCGKECKSELGKRQHHAEVHGESLPNAVCEYCGKEWYDETSDRKRCPSCPDQITPPPDYYSGTPGEWESLTAYKRWYIQNKQREKSRTKEQRKRKLQKLKEYKSGLECRRCGFDDHYAALDFHHPDEDGDERMSPSKMANNNHAWDKILAEIKTLDVLCANCHRILHNE